MPVSVAITVADPPAAPPGYTLCAFEVRNYRLSGEGVPALAVFPGTTDGFEAAANAMKEHQPGAKLTAVAWWVDRPLTECQDGRERLASTYSMDLGWWDKWEPEERIGVRRNEEMPEHGTLKVRRTDDISKRLLRGQSEVIRVSTNRSDKT